METTKVLVIDDSVIIQRILQHYSQALNIEITAAYTGLEGLLKLTEDNFDIVFLDLNLPDSNGLELAQRIRETPSQNTLNTVPIIMLTGSNIDELRDSKYINDCLEKPLSCEDFDKTIKNWLSKDI